MTKFVNKQIGELFTFDSSKCIYHAIDLPIIKPKPEKGYYRYVVRSAENNGIKGYIKKPTSGLNPGNTISCAQDTAEFFYQSEPYFTGNKVKVMNPIGFKLTQQIALYLLTVIKQGFQIFGWGSSYNVDVMKKVKIQVPVTATGALDTDYMVSYVRKIEASYVRKIEAYLSVLGYKSMADVQLIEPEQKLLAGGIQAQSTSKFIWQDLSNTYKPKRGTRIRSLDRIKGKIPFVTAGAESQGISNYIEVPNNVDIWPANTITIDMFGYTLLRSYEFAVDDHVTCLRFKGKYNVKQLLFIATAIQKAIPQGKFSYGKNFYPKDVASIAFELPVTSSGDPNWQFMEDYITAIEKLKVLKLKQFLDHKLDLYQQAIK